MNGNSLQGVRVVEIGTSVAVPYAGQILGDFGAEVIKVERLGGGDEGRSWAPMQNGVSMTFLSLNRNKKSVVLDYKDPRGKALLEDLLRTSDVLIQNLRPGALDKAGFTWERLHELNPRLVYAEMTGYGHTGPRHFQAAYDAMLQAYSGIVAMTGSPDGEPSRIPISMMDMGTGMWIAMGVFAALRQRDVTGEGSHLNVSLLQTALAWVQTPAMSVALGAPAPERLGSGFRGNVPNGAFPTSDGYAFLSCGNNDTFHRLCDVIGAPELKDDPLLADNPTRVKNRRHTNEALGAATSRFTTAELIAILEKANIPNSAVNTLDQVLADEQVLALGQVAPMPIPEIPDMRIVNLPVMFDGAYLEQQAYPPELAKDTVEVLTGLGLSEADVAGLLEAGVIETYDE